MLLRLFGTLLAIGEEIAGWFQSWGWKLLILILASAGAAYPVYRLVTSVGEKIDLAQLKKKDARRFIVQCYREMERQLSRKKLPRRPFCSPTEYLRIVALKLPQVTTPMEDITLLFNRVRYSSGPVSATDADSAFAAYRSLVERLDGKPEE